MTDKIEVTQADRDAAADAVKAYRDNKNGNWQARIRDGECDDGEMVQSFARHAHAARIEGARAAIEAAATLVAEKQQTSSNVEGAHLSPRYEGNRDGFAYIDGIHALDPEQIVKGMSQ